MYRKSLVLVFLAAALQGCEPPPAASAPAPMDDDKETVMVDQSYALVGTSWWVEDILAAGVVDRSRTTIGFFEDQRVAGNSGCNRFTGGFEMNGDAMSFTPLAGTMMACPPALMNQERRFHEAMEQVESWRIDKDTGLLHLQNGAGETVIRASELPEGEEP